MLKVRLARPSEVYVVIDLLLELAEFESLEKDFNPDPDLLSRQISQSANPWLRACLAFEESQAVGVALFYEGEYSSFKTSWRIHLEDVYVKPEYRGRGLLRKLLVQAAQAAWFNGTHELTLSVLDWNTEAIAAYEKLGAVEVGYRIDESGNNWRMMAIRGKALKALT